MYFLNYHYRMSSSEGAVPDETLPVDPTQTNGNGKRPNDNSTALLPQQPKRNVLKLPMQKRLNGVYLKTWQSTSESR